MSWQSFSHVEPCRSVGLYEPAAGLQEPATKQNPHALSCIEVPTLLHSYTKLKKLDVQEGKKDKLFADYVTQVCAAHNRVILSFHQQLQGGLRPTTEASRENIGHNVHV